MIFGVTAFIRPQLFESVGWFPGRGGRFGEPLPPRDPADFSSERPWIPLDPTQVAPGRVQAVFYRAFGAVFAVARARCLHHRNFDIGDLAARASGRG